MLLSKKKDHIKRKLFYKYEQKNKKHKFLVINSLNRLSGIHLDQASIISFFSQSKIEKSNKIKLVRRCILNNRSRGSTRKFGVSRVLLREFIKLGVIPGFKKSSW